MMNEKKYQEEFKSRKCIAKDTWQEANIRNTPITQKENMIRFLKKENPVFQAFDGDNLQFTPRLIPENTARALVLDGEYNTPYIKGGKDFFGVVWDYVPEVDGSMVRPGHPKVPDINEWEKYISFPDLSEYDWEGSAAVNKDYLTDDLPVYVMLMNGLFERLISLMGFEEAVVALIDEEQKEGVHRFFDKLSDFYDELLDDYAKYYHATTICFHDDWGSQMAPFFSRATCEEMLVPYLIRIFESIHKRNMFVDFHSCGKHEILTPCMIEAKADIWFPQTMNDIDGLYQQYGNEIVFGIPLTSDTGTDEESYEIASNFMEKYGKNKNVLPYAYFDPMNPDKFLSPKVMEDIYCMSREMYGGIAV